jgi:GDSL-like lipase/acylhydrolase family protein
MSAGSRRAEVALLLVTMAFSLGVIEVGVRLVGADRPRPLGYSPVNTDVRERRPINAQGYRDVEHAKAKPPGARRIVFLGDSFTWGASVLFEDTYAQRVERALRRRGESWEAINLAEPGMNTVQEAARLASEGFAYDPDVVVLGYVLNDSEDENAAEARRAADWLADRQKAPAEPRSFLDRSALYRLVSTRILATLENRRRVSGFLSMYAPDYSGWIAGQKALKELGGMCRERGVPLVVVIFPLFGNALDEGYPFAEIHARVARVAGEAGAKVVDLLPYYRGLRPELLVVNGAADEHPNEIAHRIAAQTLFKALDDVVPKAVP